MEQKIPLPNIPEPSETLVNPPVNSSSFKKPFLIVLLVILLVILSSLGTYLFVKSQTPSPTPVVSPTPTISASLIPSTADETANWKIYTNTKYGYEFKYPETFSLVKGPASNQPEEYFKELASISFSGMSKNSDQNAGVVFGITVNPTNSEGQPIICSTNNECLQKWMKVLNSTTNQVNYINISNQRIQGFEYQTSNKLYKQNNSYYVFLEKGKIWLISLIANNYSQQEVIPVFNQILSTFKFLDQTGQSPLASPIANPAKKLNYFLPTGWKTIQDKTGTFEIGYNPETDLIFGPSSINDLNIGLTKVGQYGGSSYNLTIKPYDGGSRHNFILGPSGIQEQDKMADYHEKNYTYNGWSCLVLYGVSISQWPSTQGMCAIDSKRAFAFGTWKDEAATEQIIQTIKLLK